MGRGKMRRLRKSARREDRERFWFYVWGGVFLIGLIIAGGLYVLFPV